MEQEKLWNKDFIAFCLSNFFIFLSMNTLMTTLPLYIVEALKYSDKEIGYVLFSFMAGAVIIRLFIGTWVDSMQRERILFISLLLYLLANISYVGAQGLVLLIILRFFHGIMFGSASTAMMAIVTELPPPNRRGEGIGYFSLSNSLASILGPFLGLLIVAHFNFHVLFTVCSIYALLAYIFVKIAKLPIRNMDAQPVIAKKAFRVSTFVDKKTLPIALTGCFIALAQSSIHSYIPVFADSLGLMKIASYFFVIFATMMLISRTFTGRIFDKYGAKYVIYPSLLLFMIGFLCLSITKTAPLFLITAAILGLGAGTIMPSFITLATTSHPPTRRGVATSTYFLFWDLGIGAGAVLLGVIANQTGYQEMYSIAACFVAIACASYFFMQQREKKNASYVKGGKLYDNGE